MTPRRTRPARRGVLLAEAGLVYAVTLLLVVGSIVVGLGVFRHHQVAWLAREGARWAAVHGPTYQAEQSQAAPTSASVLINAVTPRMVALKLSALTPTLTWNTTASPQTVSFRLDYAWTPEGYFSPITFTSTSTQVIMY